MKAKREYLDYFKDILDALEKIDDFTAGLDFEGFASDAKTTFAVIRALEIIGEAARDSQIHPLPLSGHTLAGHGGDAG